MSIIVKAGKQAKKLIKSIINTDPPPVMSVVRRINRVAIRERVCAMTFDDGPFALPCSPDNFSGRALPAVLLDTLGQYGARGTFVIVGDTSANYPDRAGRERTAQWGGLRYDHYPDINCDSFGGALNQPELIGQMLAGGHELANHGCAHIIFGPKRLVYLRREYLTGFDEVVNDLKRLHDYIENEFGCTMRLARPPHYVDKIGGGLTAYDAYAALGYQYMGASFDGAGWLPLGSYEDEVAAMTEPLRTALERDPGALCGQIIFQKDGYNMARRTPVADGQRRQLDILSEYGYRVVTVSELMNLSQFSDIGSSHEIYSDALKLIKSGRCAAYSDNTVCPDKTATRGELAMLLHGGEKRRIVGKNHFYCDIPASHPYGTAIRKCVEDGKMELSDGKFRPDAPLGAAELYKATGADIRGDDPARLVTRGECIRLLAKMQM